MQASVLDWHCADDGQSLILLRAALVEPSERQTRDGTDTQRADDCEVHPQARPDELPADEP
jgi:hypothetical protein